MTLTTDQDNAVKILRSKWTIERLIKAWHPHYSNRKGGGYNLVDAAHVSMVENIRMSNAVIEKFELEKRDNVRPPTLDDLTEKYQILGVTKDACCIALGNDNVVGLYSLTYFVQCIRWGQGAVPKIIGGTRPNYPVSMRFPNKMTVYLAPRVEEDSYMDDSVLTANYRGLIDQAIDVRVHAPDMFGLKPRKLDVKTVEDYFKDLDPDMPLELAIDMYNQWKLGITTEV